jgi:hypothetical protein
VGLNRQDAPGSRFCEGAVRGKGRGGTGSVAGGGRGEGGVGDAAEKKWGRRGESNGGGWNASSISSCISIPYCFEHPMNFQVGPRDASVAGDR